MLGSTAIEVEAAMGEVDNLAQFIEECYEERGTGMVNKLCSDILEAFKEGSSKGDLFHKLYALPSYCFKNPITSEAFDALIELEREIMNSKGQYKRYIEEEVLGVISMISFEEKIRISEGAFFKLSLPKKSCNEQKVRVAEKLKEFAFQIFAMKRERDTFNSKRKGFALRMLGNIAASYDCPEASEKCLMALRSKKNDLILAAFEFLEEHYIHQKYQLASDIIEELDKIVEQTKSRSIAVGALDIQVQAGEISELEGLSRIDDWKEKNYKRIHH